MFSLFALVTNTSMPRHRTNPHASYSELFMNRFHEVNEQYDGKPFMYATEISSNECFIFSKSNETDKHIFVETIEKEINTIKI